MKATVSKGFQKENRKMVSATKKLRTQLKDCAHPEYTIWPLQEETEEFYFFIPLDWWQTATRGWFLPPYSFISHFLQQKDWIFLDYGGKARLYQRKADVQIRVWIHIQTHSERYCCQQKLFFSWRVVICMRWT